MTAERDERNVSRADDARQADASAEQTREIVLAARGAKGGVAVLFTGPSGTRGTMAAAAIARELGRDLHVVDMRRAVSKYIGDTEKNIDRAFGQAAASDAVLLFDEADALFGKRSEVKDSHDRFANVEVTYLLQRMEAHTGLVILATNQKKTDLDASFLRRLRFVLDFPLPGPRE